MALRMSRKLVLRRWRKCKARIPRHLRKVARAAMCGDAQQDVAGVLAARLFMNKERIETLLQQSIRLERGMAEQF